MRRMCHVEQMKRQPENFDCPASLARRRLTPNYREQPQCVAMFYADSDCCSHCRHGSQFHRRVYCNMIRIHARRSDGQTNVPRSLSVVAWNGICDLYEHRFRKRKYVRRANP